MTEIIHRVCQQLRGKPAHGKLEGICTTYKKTGGLVCIQKESRTGVALAGMFHSL
jgi:hypothetical protein